VAGGFIEAIDCPAAANYHLSVIGRKGLTIAE
jgi:hypothetical protein